MWLSIIAARRLFASAMALKVAGEVQVDVFHRHHLRIAAAGRAALHAEDGPSEGSRRQMIAFLPI
jgi:hypothetical protein